MNKRGQGQIVQERSFIWKNLSSWLKSGIITITLVILTLGYMAIFTFFLTPYCRGKGFCIDPGLIVGVLLIIISIIATIIFFIIWLIRKIKSKQLFSSSI